MSALCHYRTHAAHNNVRDLFDYLVGAQQEGRWNLETYCLGGLEIDGEIPMHRRLKRQVPGFVPLRILSTKAAALGAISAMLGP